MITVDEIKRVAKLMRIELDDYDAHTVKIQKMIEYFDHLDSVNLADSFKCGLTVHINSLRKDVYEPTNFDILKSLKFGAGEHMRSPKLR